MSPLRHLPFVAAGFLALGLTACREKPVAHYRISKESLPASTSSGAGHAHAMAANPTQAAGNATKAHAAALTWSAPPHWTSVPSSPPRHATYTFTGEHGATAELAVTDFPGDVGGELANVNRWRGQVLLDPTSSEAHAAAVERLQVGDRSIALVDFTGGSSDAPVRLVGAIVPLAESTWFFKFTGAPEVIEREMPAFRALLQTIHRTGGKDACCDS